MKAEYKEKIKELNEELLKLDVLKRESYMDWKKTLYLKMIILYL